MENQNINDQAIDLSSKEIQTLEQANDEVVKRNINPDVFNALNLYDERLGEEYEKQGYNPFSPDFKLTKEFAEDVLEHKQEKSKAPKEDFLEVGAKKATSYFKNTLTAGEKLIEGLERRMGDMANATSRQQLQKAIIFLKNRNQLLKLNIRELKYRNANAIQMYADMYSMDKELSELLKESYQPNANIDQILHQFVETCKKRANKELDKRKKEKERELQVKRDFEEAWENEMDSENDLEDFLEDLMEIVEDFDREVKVKDAPEMEL